MNQRFEARISDYFRFGWNLYTQRPLLLSGASLFFGLCAAIFSPAPIAWAAISAPLFAGMYSLIIRIDDGSECEFKNFFDGFAQFIPLLLVSVVTSLLVTVGLLLFVIPGLYLMLAYGLSVLFVLDKKMSFWDAMENSRKMVTAHFGDYLLFAVLCFAIGVIALIPFGLGAVVALPVVVAAHYAFYRDLVGHSSSKRSDEHEPSVDTTDLEKSIPDN
jgi:uncharacterized membrane protein